MQTTLKNTLLSPYFTLVNYFRKQSVSCCLLKVSNFKFNCQICKLTLRNYSKKLGFKRTPPKKIANHFELIVSKNYLIIVILS